jgi:putative nucleotidyltransferase with HDIG domain
MRPIENDASASEHIGLVGDLVDRAAGLVHSLLARDVRRLRHCASVATQAERLRPAVANGDGSLLVAAAWLHDIGYAQALRDKDFHPLDGARWLQAEGWHPVICNLVANHSGSRFVAADRGLDADLAEFPYVETPLADALTVADQTTGPGGEPMTIEARMCEMLARHGPYSANARVHRVRAPYIRQAAHRVRERLLAADAAPVPLLTGPRS